MSLTKAVLAAGVRAVLQILAGWLLAHSIIDQSLHGRLITEGSAAIAGALMLFLGTYGWSIWQKIKAKLKVMVALDTPSEESVAEVEAKVDAMPLRKQIRMATSPGNVPLPKTGGRK